MAAKKSKPSYGSQDEPEGNDIPGAPFTLEQAQQEFMEAVTGQAMPPGQTVQQWMNMFRFTERSVSRLGANALAMLYSWVVRGDRRCILFLVDMTMRASDKPYEEKIKTLNEGQIKEVLFQEYRGKGLSEEEARKQVDMDLQSGVN